MKGRTYKNSQVMVKILKEYTRGLKENMNKNFEEHRKQMEENIWLLKKRYKNKRIEFKIFRNNSKWTVENKQRIQKSK